MKKILCSHRITIISERVITENIKIIKNNILNCAQYIFLSKSRSQYKKN